MLPVALLGLILLIGVPYATYLFLSRLLDPWESPAAKTFEPEPVSVVLPTYNEERLVGSTLDRLTSLEYPADALEIVVVDSSTDDTAAVVRQVADSLDDADPEIRLVEESERRGVASAVNRAVEAASNDVIFRTDCDSRIGAETIRHAVANLQDDRVGGVTGRQTEVLGSSDVEQEYRDLQARNQALESHLDSTFIIHGPCFAFRREFFEPIPADALADDTEIAVNIRRQGKRVVFDPELTFAESGVSDVRGRRQRKDRRAMGLIQLLVRHREMLGRFGLYGRVILPFNWWFLLIAPWLTAALVGVSVVGALALFGPLGLAVPAALAGFVALGSCDRLGPLQAVYAVFDSNLSLVIASMRLLGEGSDGTWEIDADSRDVFDRDS